MVKKWFGFKYEVIYFTMLNGPKQISKGSMSTVIGIFENDLEIKNHWRMSNQLFSIE